MSRNLIDGVVPRRLGALHLIEKELRGVRPTEQVIILQEGLRRAQQRVTDADAEYRAEIVDLVENSI